MKEKPAFSLPGGVMLLVILAAIVLTVLSFINEAQAHDGTGVFLCMFAFFVEALMLKGLIVVNPNEAQVVQLFGRYVGTVRQQGFRWLNPFTSKRKISLRVRNFETAKLKVNDLDGNPIEIAAWWCGRWWIRRKPSLKSTTTRTSCKCRANPRCATWPLRTPTTRTSRGK